MRMRVSVRVIMPVSLTGAMIVLSELGMEREAVVEMEWASCSFGSFHNSPMEKEYRGR